MEILECHLMRQQILLENNKKTVQFVRFFALKQDELYGKNILFNNRKIKNIIYIIIVKERILIWILIYPSHLQYNVKLIWIY